MAAALVRQLWNPAEGRRRSGEDDDLLRGDPPKCGEQVARGETGGRLPPCHHVSLLSIGIAKLLMGLISVEKPAASRCLIISR
jgi:hypothetical protein